MDTINLFDRTEWGVIEIRTPSTNEMVTTVTVEDLFQAFKDRILIETNMSDQPIWTGLKERVT